MRLAANNGFTLLELLVVIIILALTSTLVGINLGGDRANLESIARTLVTDLRYVRSKAMVGNTDTALVVDLDNGAYYSRAARIDRPLPASISVELTVDVRDTDGKRGSIVFYPDGSSSGGKLRLSRNGRSLQITTAWLNGYVTLEE
jgi:general secretion pathway protein H